MRWKQDEAKTAPHKKLDNVHHLPVQVIASETMRPIHPPWQKVNLHVAVLIDYYCRYCIVIAIKQDDDLQLVVLQTIPRIAKHVNRHFLEFGSDHAKEYLSKRIPKYMYSIGINHTTRIAHRPHGKGVTERLHQTLAQTARADSSHAQMPDSLWNFAIVDTA